MKKHFLIAFAFCLLTSSLFSQGVWTQKADFGGAPRQGAVGFSIGTKGYIGTGVSGGSASKVFYKDFWEWDQSTNVWTQKADFGGNVRCDAVGFSIGVKGYIGTGGSSNGPISTYYNDFWEWDQATNMWTQQADFAGVARACAVGFSIGLKGYIGVGRDASYQIDFWEWDQSTNVWTPKANFAGIARIQAVGFGIGSKGYLGTGLLSASPFFTNDFWEWDQATNIWTQKASFGGMARQSPAAFSIGLQGYIGTGYSGVEHTDFWGWDQNTNVWSQKSNFSGVATLEAVGFCIGNKGYIGTGYAPGGQSKDFWEYCDTCTDVSINEFKNQISLSISPNPFSIRTTFAFSESIRDASLKIYSISGQEVKRLQVSGSKFQVERGNLVGGIYFYQINFENKSVATGKLFIQ